MFSSFRVAAQAAGACAALFAAVGSADAQLASGSQPFQGAYVGIMPLYGWAKSDVTLTRPGFDPATGSRNVNGPAIGAFAGYDWRIGTGGVIGVVGDVGVAKFSNTKAAPVGTVRARLGQVVAPGLLVYATGGRAFVQQSLSGTLGGVAYDVKESTSGWTYGAGLETQVAVGAQPVRLGLEVLRTNFNAFDFDAGTRNVAIANSVWTVGARVGIPLK